MANKRPRSLVERDYTAFYARDVGGQAGNDHVVYKHPNGLCVVCLAPHHPLLALDAAALAAHKVDFDVGSSSRLKAQVTGKKKSNAAVVMGETALCHITAPDGAVFKIRGCVRGKLLEVKDRLVATPALLVQQPKTAGFIAILMPREQDVKSNFESMESAEAYVAARSEAGEAKAACIEFLEVKDLDLEAVDVVASPAPVEGSKPAAEKAVEMVVDAAEVVASPAPVEGSKPAAEKAVEMVVDAAEVVASPEEQAAKKAKVSLIDV